MFALYILHRNHLLTLQNANDLIACNNNNYKKNNTFTKSNEGDHC